MTFESFNIYEKFSQTPHFHGTVLNGNIKKLNHRISLFDLDLEMFADKKHRTVQTLNIKMSIQFTSGSDIYIREIQKFHRF